MAKNPHAMQESREMQVQSLGWEDFQEEETITHSSILSTHAGGINRGPERREEVASGWRYQGC